MSDPHRVETVAVTGANGYVGRLLCRHFESTGSRVVRLVRRPSADPASLERGYDLASPCGDGLLEGVDTLIHAAWSLGASRAADAWATNVDGSMRLIQCAIRSHVGQIVFISSMSAYEGTRQSYGLMKLSVEQGTRAAGGAVVRPGLVLGEPRGGMAATLTKVASLPLWPRLRGAELYVIEDADLASTVACVVSNYSSFSRQVVSAAYPTAVPLGPLLRALAHDGLPKTSVAIPPSLVMASLRAVELVGIRLPFRSDSLLGLVEPPPGTTGADILSACGRPLQQRWVGAPA